MTELEWLKQESGMTDEELKAMETAMGSGKFKATLVKVIAANEQATSAARKAEDDRLALEKRYNDEFLPEMRKVTTDALRATGEAARLKAELEQARQYGIVPEPPANPTAPTDPPRAPGSPDPNLVSRDDFGRFSAAQSRTLISLNDLNAEHFKLFGEPLGDTQGLVDEVQRQHTLGNKAFTLRAAWEAKHAVDAKRKEIAEASQKKHDDAIRAEERKKIAEAGGANPNLRSGRASRFDTYKQTDSTKEPWKAPHSKTQSNREWRQSAVAKIREFAAA